MGGSDGDCANDVCNSTELEVDRAVYGGPGGVGCSCTYDRRDVATNRSLADIDTSQGDEKRLLAALSMLQHLHLLPVAPICVDWACVRTMAIQAAQYRSEV